MTNYRSIFNSSYNYIGIMLIILIAALIMIVQKDFITSIYKICKISIVSSSITTGLAIMLNFVTRFLIISNYKIFIEIIIKNIISNLFFYSVFIIIVSGILILMLKIAGKKSS